VLGLCAGVGVDEGLSLLSFDGAVKCDAENLWNILIRINADSARVKIIQSMVAQCLGESNGQKSCNYCRS